LVGQLGRFGDRLLPSGRPRLHLGSVDVASAKAHSAHLRTLAKGGQPGGDYLPGPRYLSENNPDAVACPVAERRTVAIGFRPKAEVVRLHLIDAGLAQTAEQLLDSTGYLSHRRGGIGAHGTGGQIDGRLVGYDEGLTHGGDSDPALHFYDET
jgi:hypothetical protein